MSKGLYRSKAPDNSLIGAPSIWEVIEAPAYNKGRGGSIGAQRRGPHGGIA